MRELDAWMLLIPKSLHPSPSTDSNAMVGFLLKVVTERAVPQVRFQRLGDTRPVRAHTVEYGGQR